MSLSLGAVIWCCIKPILKMYLIIGCGIYLGKKNILNVETTKHLSTIMLNILIPCLIFNKVISNISIDDLKAIGIICLSSFLLYVGGFLISMPFILLNLTPKRFKGGFIAACMFQNVSDIPIAYIQTLSSGLIFTQSQGEKGIAYICIFMACLVFLTFNLGGYKLIQYDFIQDKKRQSIQNKDPEKSLIVNEIITSNIQPTNDNDNDNFDFNHSGSTVYNQTNPIQAVISSNSNIDLHPEDIYQYTSASTVVSQSSLPSLEQLAAPINHFYNDDQRSIITDIGIINETKPKKVDKKSSITIAAINTTAPTTTTDNNNNHSIPIQNTNEKHEIFNNINNNGTALVNDNTNENTKKSKKKIILHTLYTIFYEFFSNFLQPIALSLLISLTIALIPWVRVLFIEDDSINIPNAPDDQPPLELFIDFTYYIGSAQVPIGLLLLGGSLGKLKFNTSNKILKKFSRTAVLLAIIKLCLFPIIGITWVTGLLNNFNWLDTADPNSKMLCFVIVLIWSLPSFTAQIYLTAFYTPSTSNNDDIDNKDQNYNHFQLDSFALCLMCQYPILFISIPFIATFILKVTLGY
ncbi:AEC family transporter [Ascoidea rubescens DSM 1968]|uniref:Auxin efflux carrier n=1 Tax=Ascoidea rubescens DSM 1968 TaxID=1344418 RepID=A0A1D2VQN0_9ASCO|nr:auxin efflux carrier [Ascoidea rubescens DSM 1968]ODV63888.1 auxin efflux carrier [Ascoidea rubescens DSM 1968]